MDNNHFTTARNAQIVLYLLKEHGIRKVIASPGTQNMSLVLSMQRDPFFEMYSAPDERSAAYMACGLAAESGEAVVLSCTGATASRNYVPGLTEAFYRHLPVVAITSTERTTAVGHDIAQVIDRLVIQHDIAKISVKARKVLCDDDAWDCMIQVNRALLELNHHGRGPVHINLEKTNDSDFSCEVIPPCRVIRRVCRGEKMPELPKGRIAVFVGSHVPFDAATTKAIDVFCAQHDAAVFCDQTSNYYGRYRMQMSLVASQDWYESPLLDTYLLIILGDVSGDYYQGGRLGGHAKQVWRVNEDGLIKDSFRKLTYIFEMSEQAFFHSYYETDDRRLTTDDYLNACKVEYHEVLEQIPELPLCNIWIAKTLATMIPQGSVLHFGILNSLRSWNFFNVPGAVAASSNVGGFGIDGDMSTLIGASLAHPAQLHFGFFGDLAFFYDMNSLGNRHVGTNLRIMLINNAKGSEFKLYHHPASRFGTEADQFIAAGGHYGCQSPQLVRHYAEDLGFRYLTASTKEEFLAAAKTFVATDDLSASILFEVFTSDADESAALKTINSLKKSKENQRKDKIKKLIGEENIHSINNLFHKIKG